MAVVLHEIKDSDFEYVVKVTTTSTNSAVSIVDVSAADTPIPSGGEEEEEDKSFIIRNGLKKGRKK